MHLLRSTEVEELTGIEQLNASILKAITQPHTAGLCVVCGTEGDNEPFTNVMIGGDLKDITKMIGSMFADLRNQIGERDFTALLMEAQMFSIELMQASLKNMETQGNG